jgi:hypothetical protein
VSYVLKLRGVIVGRSELEHRDVGASLASGEFRPGLGYELVQPVFRLFTEAVGGTTASPNDEAKLERYHRAREALPLELFDGAGRRLETGRIHIADRTEEEGPKAIALEVVVSDPTFWEGHVPGR